jgi:hypothetical protein
MPAGTVTRNYRDTVLEQGKVALTEARKPLFAAVGATNLAYGQLRSQLRELPGETQEQLRRLQEEAQSQLKKLQDRAGDRAGELAPGQVSARLRKTVEEYAAQARETYDTLAHRGEKVVRQLRRDRRVREVFAETEELVERAEETVTGRSAGAPHAAATHRAAPKAPARKAPARRPATKA